LVLAAAWLLSTPYSVAMLIACLEHFLEVTYTPRIKIPLITALGVCFIIVGESLRKTAIITAGHNFTHKIQFSRREAHALVTHGVYHYMRHPGYAGWVLWAIGTQLVLCNPLCAVLFAVVVRIFLPFFQPSNLPFLGAKDSCTPPIIADVLLSPCGTIVQAFKFMKRRIEIEDSLLKGFFGQDWLRWRQGVPSGIPFIP